MERVQEGSRGVKYEHFMNVSNIVKSTMLDELRERIQTSIGAFRAFHFVHHSGQSVDQKNESMLQINSIIRDDKDMGFVVVIRIIQDDD